MKFHKRLRSVFLSAAILFVSAATYAQGPSGPGDGSGGDPDQNVPLDGGLSVLVAAAVGYGARKKYLAGRGNKPGAADDGPGK